MSKRLPESILVYLNKDDKLLDRWTVVFPDGAVFTMGDKISGAPGLVSYLCQHKDFTPDKDDVLVKHDELPADLVLQIRQSES